MEVLKISSLHIVQLKHALYATFFVKFITFVTSKHEILSSQAEIDKEILDEI